MEYAGEEPVMDIDSADKNNPLAVVEYIDDLYAYYKKVEVGYSCFLLFPSKWLRLIQHKQ